MNIAARVKALGLPSGSYAVFGSGPLAARGLREARDLDIVITPELFKQMATDPTWKLGELRDHHRVLSREGVELFDSWAPGSWDVYELIRNADLIEGVPYVSLPSVVEWKTLRDSDKDKQDIALINAFLSRQA